MTFVHAGVLLGDAEELVNDYIVHNDEHGIEASLGAVDSESDISEYYVSIGTAEGKVHCLCCLQLIHLYKCAKQTFTIQCKYYKE